MDCRGDPWIMVIFGWLSQNTPFYYYCDRSGRRDQATYKIPDEFLPHSARAAGMAQGKTIGMTDDEVCTRSNVSRPTYIKYYQRQIRTAAYQPPAGIT